MLQNNSINQIANFTIKSTKNSIFCI